MKSLGALLIIFGLFKFYVLKYIDIPTDNTDPIMERNYRYSYNFLLLDGILECICGLYILLL